MPKSDKVYLIISFALVLLCAIGLYIGVTGYFNIISYDEAQDNVALSVYLAVSSICFALSALFSLVAFWLISLCLGTNNKVIKGFLITFMVVCGAICIFSAYMLKRL